jgi:hypothetical protein
MAKRALAGDACCHGRVVTRSDPELGEVLEAVQDEILEDRETLRRVMRSLNVEPGAVKQVAGRIAGAALRLHASETVTRSAELSLFLRSESRPGSWADRG